MTEPIELANKEHPCPCCGYMSFEEPPGSYDICSICFWEDDEAQLRNPFSGGANGPLVEEQKTYARIGSSEERILPYVRKPVEGDVRCPDWRPFDPKRDAPGDILSGQAYFHAACKGGEGEPYYWRRMPPTISQDKETP